MRASADTQSAQGASESGCTNADFTPAATSPEVVGALPNHTAVGDFNLDGKPDLATANNFTTTLTILIGDGTGNFPSTSTETVGNNPSSVVMGDFNLDGKADLATANSGSHNVTILIGDGTGHFTQPTDSPEAAPNNPKSVVAGDFDADGRPELAVVTGGSNNLTILLATCGNPPAITAQAVSQVADTTSNNLLIATVSDTDQAPGTLAVTISPDGNSFSGTATVNGVTVSNIAVDATGNVRATVAATCAATTVPFTLKVTDAIGADATATLTVTVTPEMEDPTITCPANLSVMTVSSCEVVNYTAPTTSDNCTLPANAVVCTPPQAPASPPVRRRSTAR